MISSPFTTIISTFYSPSNKVVSTRIRSLGTSITSFVSPDRVKLPTLVLADSPRPWLKFKLPDTATDAELWMRMVWL